MVLTSAVGYDGTRLRGGCESPATAVTPSGAASQAPQSGTPVFTQNAVVAATKTITCKDLQYVGP